MRKLLILTFFIALGSTEKVRYDNYALYTIRPSTGEQLDYLNILHDANEGFHFWSVPTAVDSRASVVSPPQSRGELEEELTKRDIRFDVVLDDIQKAFDEQSQSMKKRESGLQWTNYQSIDEIYEWLQSLARDHGSFVSLIQAGQSYEGRNITGVRIARRPGGPAFFIDGGQVGADWLSPAVVTYLINQLVSGDDPEARAASEEYEWHIFPFVNPDGHVFSRDSVRLWLKNRRPTQGSEIGVDLTKNWNSQWGVSGGSFNPSRDNYIGLGPFSEPETRAVSHYIGKIGYKLRGLLSFRAFGERLLIPFAHSSEAMYNYQEMIKIGRRAMGSLAVRYNTQYLVGTSRDVHDGSTGTVADWTKHRFNPPVVATYQLRDRVWGYTMPANQVLPACEETFDSVMAILREAKFINVL